MTKPELQSKVYKVLTSEFYNDGRKDRGIAKYDQQKGVVSIYFNCCSVVIPIDTTKPRGFVLDDLISSLQEIKDAL